MKKRSIIILSTILTIFLVTVSTISIIVACEKPTIKYDNDTWITGEYKNIFMSDLFMDVIPEPSEVDGYDDSMFYSCYYRDAFFKYTFGSYCSTDSFALELTFSEENYKKAELDLFEKYVFLEEPVFNENHQMWRMPFTETKLGDYTLKIIYDHPYRFLYPMDTPFVAFNGKNKIRYCYQYNESRDEVDNGDELLKYIQKGFKLDW